MVKVVSICVWWCFCEVDPNSKALRLQSFPRILFIERKAMPRTLPLVSYSLVCSPSTRANSLLGMVNDVLLPVDQCCMREETLWIFSLSGRQPEYSTSGIFVAYVMSFNTGELPVANAERYGALQCLELLEGRSPMNVLVESTLAVYTSISVSYFPCKTVPTPLDSLLEVRHLDQFSNHQTRTYLSSS